MKTIASDKANTDAEDFVSFMSDESDNDEMKMDNEEIEMSSDKQKSKVHFWLTLLILILIHNTGNLQGKSKYHAWY